MRRSIFTPLLVSAGLALCPMLTTASGYAEAGEQSVVRLSRPEYEKALQQGIAFRSTIDYGTFVWAELNASGFGELASSDVIFEQQPDAYTLRLGEMSFDPAKGEPVVADSWDELPVGGSGLQLVQFAGPTRAEWLDNLEARGLEVVQYIHPFTYVVWGEADALSTIARTGAVRWTGSFLPAYRVLPRWQNLREGAEDVTILIYRGANAVQVVEALKALGAKVGEPQALNATWAIAKASLAGNKFLDAAKIPGVYSMQVEPTDGGLRGEMSDQVCADNVDASSQAFPGYPDWLALVGVDGAGVIIANVDGGVQDTHPDLAARLIGCTGTSCGGTTTSSHGTHTAGLMAADGSSGTLDGYGFLRGLGVAPGANLVEQLYSPTYIEPGGMLLLMTESYNNGASLSGNSWGPSGSPLGYDDDTLQVDIGSRDTDPDAPGDQPLTYVLSIMNGYGGTSSQGTPDEAKNIFTIGSTKMQNVDGSQILDINDLSANSAHGPCLDGRKIPHLVAPGCRVDSSDSSSSYSLKCGTSMASPHVSGAVALFIEYYRGLPGYVSDPSPALVKAAFLPVAHDLAGYADADGLPMGHPFDNKQGWGRMDLPPVVDPPAASVRYFDQEVLFDNTGEDWSITVSPFEPTEPMRIMLVWTDAPGHGLGGSTPAWNNDLDLVVEVGADAYLGNNFGSDGWSQTGGTADGMNNTEGVFLGPAAPGSATIRVVASNINSDGVPNMGDTTDQDFALVCYNCAEEPGFMLDAEPSSLEVCAPDEAMYTIDVGQILGFSDPVTLSAGGHPAGTTATFSVNPVTPPGSSVLTIGDTTAASPGTYDITVEGVAGDLIRQTGVALTLSTAAPDAASLISPADGASGVSVTPTFTWTAADQASEYLLEVAADSSFTDVVYSAGEPDTSHETAVPFDTSTQYFWHVRATNVCGDGPYSATYSFTTLDVPPILLVDDDDNSPDARAYYTDTLDALGMAYDVWDTENSDNEPDAASLAPYTIVIWFTGDEYGGFAGPGTAGEAALAEWLDTGSRCLFISSQDYYYDRGLTPFMTDYLGAASVSSDVSQTQVTGAGSVFGGTGTFTLSYPFTNWSDEMTVGASAEVAFNGDQGIAGANKDNGTYRTIFWVFPFEAISSPSDRQDLMSIILEHCIPSGPPCAELPDPAVCMGDANGDGSVTPADAGLVKYFYGSTTFEDLCRCDIDCDGTIDPADVGLVKFYYGACDAASPDPCWMNP